MDTNEHAVSTMSMSMQMFVHAFVHASFNTWVRPLEFQYMSSSIRVSIHALVHASVNTCIHICECQCMHSYMPFSIYAFSFLCGNQYTIYLSCVIANPYIVSHVLMPMHAFYQMFCSNTTSIIWMFIMLNIERFKCQRSQ